MAARIGPFEIVRELGRGGMGRVYEVRHPSMPARLALKLIATDLAGDETLERFGREAELLARIRHPGVVAVHTLGRTEKNQPYLVTDLVEGRNLKEVARAEPMDPSRAARILRALAAAVAAIHERGVLHRDLKPENVILRPDDAPVLLDFGLARDVDARTLTQAGAVLGTPAYMAPEQAAGAGLEKLDERTDVYGLGAILFELLAGRPPFEGTAMQMMAAVITKEPSWPSLVRPTIPAALEGVLRRCLAKDRGARYQTASALGEELDRFLRGELRAPWSRRRTRALVGAAALAGVVAVALVFARPSSFSGSSPEVATPSTASGSVSPPRSGDDAERPPWRVRGREVASFRALVAWLARPENRAHPLHEKAVEERARAWRSKVPLRRYVFSGSLGFGYVGFFGERHLLVTMGSPWLNAIDLDADPARPPAQLMKELLRAPGPASAWGFALGAPADGASPIVFSAGRAVFRASLREDGATDGADLRPFDEVEPGFAPVAKQGGDAISTAAWSRDGRLAALGGDHGIVRIYRMEGASPVLAHTIKGFRARISALAFSADGSRLLTGTWTEEARQPGRLSTWDTGTGADAAEVDELIGINPVDSVSVSPLGKLVAAGTKGLMLRADGDRAFEPYREARQNTEQVAFHPTSEPPVLYTATSASPKEMAVTKGIFSEECEVAVLRVTNRGEVTSRVRMMTRPILTLRSMEVSRDGALVLIAGWSEKTGEFEIDVWPAGD